MTMLTVMLVLMGQAAGAPDLATVRGWFEAGQHEQVVTVPVTDASAPGVVYLVAQSQAQLGRTAEARAAYTRLADRPQTDPWHFIGQSGVLLTDNQSAGAVNTARQALPLTPTVAQAQFQVGLAEAQQRNYAPAATAFEASIALDPSSAYAHYYAGLSYYRAERIDLMAKYFESFLTLAPNAPERSQVESIMRTVRGRR
jgi:tetratricopeptide (TPR) repeat protein